MKLHITQDQFQAIWGHIHMAVAGALPRGAGALNSKSRTIIDISIMLFMLSASFNAGIQYSRINALSKNQDAMAIKLEKVQSDESMVVAKLAAVEQVLIDIRDEIRNEEQDRAGHHST